jgi:hypothetical protein
MMNRIRVWHDAAGRGSRVWLVIGLALLAAAVPGCLLVHSTEHHIRLNADGSGEATLRLHNLRSDGATDSAIASDVARLLTAFNVSGVAMFEQSTRKIQGKQFMLQGDTLGVEIRYTFRSLEGVEGLRENADMLFLAVGPDNEIVRANGKVEPWMNDLRRIVWPREATHLFYVIREHTPRKSTPIVRWYRAQTQ